MINTETLTNLLLVDDETTITEQLMPFLQRSGFTVRVASDGIEALEQIARQLPDLIVLDVLMPRLDGRSLLRRLRHNGTYVPVILLTQVGESVERAMALEEGADDYLNKPFDPHELVARIKAVLRRVQQGQPSLAVAHRLRSRNLVVDRLAQRAWLDQRELVLTPKATALLIFLLLHPDEVMSRERLLDAVWGWEYPTGTRTVDTRIAELRRLLNDNADDPTFIETVSGLGYRFVAPVERAK